MNDLVVTLHSISLPGNALLLSFSEAEGSRLKTYFMDYLLCVMSSLPMYSGSSCSLTSD